MHCSYPFRSISSLKALAKALGESEELLSSIAKRSSHMYRTVPLEKKDGSTRLTFDAHEPLKTIQRKIVDRIISRVKFAQYLHGGIRDRESPRSAMSNCLQHSNSKSYIMLDIANFYPTMSTELVYSIFRRFFNFSPDASEVLTLICTKDGFLPQGASTSSYIANLAFWEDEPILVGWLRERGLRYSRYADDITISFKSAITKELQSEAIAKSIGMLSRGGFKTKRSKLHIMKRGGSISVKEKRACPTVTGFTIINESPGITRPERSRIRAAVRSLELALLDCSSPDEIRKAARAAIGRIARMRSCGYKEAEPLMARAKAVLKQVPEGI